VSYGIAVLALRVVRRLHHRIRTQEPAERGVVDAPVHMDDPEVVEVLVIGIATSGRRLDLLPLGRSRRARQSVARSPRAERLVRVLRQQRAGRGSEAVHAAEVILEQVHGARRRARFPGVDRNATAVGHDVVTV